MASAERVRIGVVGLGAVAQSVHLPILTKRRDLFDIVAVCDRSDGLLHRVADRFGLGAGGRYHVVEDLLDDHRVDAVMVLTSGSHGSVVRQALERRLAVFCEKPLAYTRAEMDLLRDRTTADARFQLGYMKLYDPAVVRAGELVAGRSAPRAVDVVVLHPPLQRQLTHAGVIPPPDPQPALDELERCVQVAVGAAPAAMRRLYEILLGSLVHDLALVRFLVSDPRRIVHVDVWPDGPVPGSVAVDAALDDDVRLTMRLHYLERYPAYREELRLHYDDGSVSLVFPSPFLLYLPTQLTVTGAVGGSVRTEGWRSTAEAFEEQLVTFWRLVTQGERPAAGLTEGGADVLTSQRVVRRLAEQLGLPLEGELRTLA